MSLVSPIVIALVYLGVGFLDCEFHIHPRLGCALDTNGVFRNGSVVSYPQEVGGIVVAPDREQLFQIVVGVGCGEIMAGLSFNPSVFYLVSGFRIPVAE